MKNIVYVLFFCASIESQNVVENLAIGLQNISMQKSKKDSYPLLGPQLLDKVDKKGNKIIIDSDKQRNIYQIRVIDQNSIKEGSLHCNFHAQRNLLYIVDMIKSPLKYFDSLYEQMLDKNKFLDWNKAVSDVTGCNRQQFSNTVTQENLKEILKKAPGSFPENMIDTKIFSFSFRYGDEDTIFTIPKWAKIIEKIESLPEKEAYKKALEAYAFDDINKYFCKNLPVDKNYIIPVKLGVYTVMHHAISLVIHKSNGTIEFLVADSLYNQEFSKAYSGNIKTTVDTAVALVSADKKELNAIAIRAMCLRLFDIIPYYLENESYYVIVFKVDQLKQLKLLDDTFYKTYYRGEFTEYMKKCNEKFEAIKNKLDMNNEKNDKMFKTFENYLKELGIRN